MPNSNARVVRGLSIANIVLSALGILASFFILFLALAVMVAAGDPSTASSVEWSFSASEWSELSRLGITPSNINEAGFGAIGIVMGICGVLCLIICVVLLIAAIINLRSTTRPEKVNGSFVWAVVGAVLSILTGSIITGILFIVAAVYLNKLKKAPVNVPGAFPAGQPGYAQPGQPVYGQAAPAAAPVPAPAAPAAPEEKKEQ